MRLLALCSLVPLLGTLGCSSKSSVSYGAPTSPSGSQTQAVGSMTSIGSSVDTSVKGMSDANQSFNVFSLMAGLQGTAINQSGGAQGLTLFPDTLDPTCVSGTAATGFTYTNCASDNTTINGSVKITPSSVTYDLNVATVTSGNTTLTLKGTVNYTGSHMSGSLEYKIHLDLGAAGGLGGLGGVANADITTNANWDFDYTSEPSCISGGTIEVTVDTAGTTHGAKFTFTGCNMLTVQNG